MAKRLADLVNETPKKKLADLDNGNQSIFSDLWDWINSGPDGSEGVFSDPVGWLTNPNNPNLKESAKAVGGGTISGLTFGAIEPFKDDVGDMGGYGVGKFVGEVAPLGLLSKTVGGAKHLAKLPKFVKPFAVGAEIGAVTGTAREAVDVAKGGDFTPEDIAIEAGTFALFDGLATMGGEAVKHLFRRKDAKALGVIAKKAREDGKISFKDEELDAVLDAVKAGKATPFYGFTQKKKDIMGKYGLNEITANERANDINKGVSLKVRRNKYLAITPNPYLTRRGKGSLYDEEGLLKTNPKSIANSAKPENAFYTEPPKVTRYEEAVLKSIFEEPPATAGQYVKDKLNVLDDLVENPIRMHERYGTKEIMYDVARETDKIAVVESKSILEEFHNLIKGNTTFFNRPSISRKIGIYATAQQKGGKEILEKMGIGGVPKLTAQEKSMYEHMRKNLEKMYVDLNKSRLEAGLTPFEKVDNYFTFWRSIDEELNMGHNLMSIDPTKITKHANQTSFSYKGKRVLDEYGEVSLDAFNIYERYMSQAVRHKHFTPVLSKFHQMLEGKFYSGFDLKIQAPEAHKNLTDWVNFLSGTRKNYLPRPIAKTMGKLNENIAFAVLSYNLRSIGIQPTAIINSNALIGPKYIKDGILGMFDKNMRKFAYDKSNHLASREFDVHITEALGSIGGRLSELKRKLGHAGIKPLQKLDEHTAVITWIGAFKKGKNSLKMTEKEAINYADDIVIKTQASGSRVDISKIQRSDLGKLVTPLQTFVINNWGFLTRDVMGLGKVSVTSDSARRKVMRYISGVMAANILFEDVLQTRSPFPAPFHAFAKEAEKSDDAGKAFWQAMLEMAEIVPVVGGDFKYKTGVGGAGVQTINDISKVIGDFDQIADGGRVTSKAFETAGKVLGIPGTSQTKKTIKLLNEVN